MVIDLARTNTIISGTNLAVKMLNAQNGECLLALTAMLLQTLEPLDEHIAIMFRDVITQCLIEGSTDRLREFLEKPRGGL